MTRSTRTAGDALAEAVRALTGAGVDSPLLDAQLLLAFAMGVRREDLHRDPGAILSRRAELIFDKSIALRARRRPLPYITGEAWFYGRPFKVNRAVLIPRPETEMLVDFARCHAPESGRIADVCTGSGCVAVSIAVEMPGARVWATDISRLALLMAAKNVRRHGVESRVALMEGDLYSPLAGRQFDLIVANPPYISRAERPDLMPEVRDYEPAIALWGDDRVDTGEDGTLIHRRLLAEGPAMLAPGGWIALEVGAGQADAVAQAAEAAGLGNLSVLKDDSGIPRVVAARRRAHGPACHRAVNYAASRHERVHPSNETDAGGVFFRL